MNSDYMNSARGPQNRPHTPRQPPLTHYSSGADHAFALPDRNQTATATPVAYYDDDYLPQGQSARQQHQERAYRAVKVLMLTFSFHDLGDSFNLETESVCQTFQNLGFHVCLYDIPLEDSERHTRSKLQDFVAEVPADVLHVVYYHGHAGPLESTLHMSSHNHPSDKDQLHADIHYLRDALLDFEVSRKAIAQSERLQIYQPVAGVSWESIRDLIIDAHCDTLVILDCCEAGLAAVTAADQDPWGRSMIDAEPFKGFRKELIGACSWGTSTQDRMSNAMCEALNVSLKGPSSGAISMPTLVRRMNNVLARIWAQNEMREHVPQAVHYLLARTRRERIILDDYSVPREAPLGPYGSSANQDY